MITNLTTRTLPQHLTPRRMFNTGLLAQASTMVTAWIPPHVCSNKSEPSRAGRSKRALRQYWIERHIMSPSFPRVDVHCPTSTHTSYGCRETGVDYIIGAVSGVSGGENVNSCRCFQSNGMAIRDCRQFYLSPSLASFICSLNIRWLSRPFITKLTNFLAGLLAWPCVRFILERFVRHPILAMGGCHGLEGLFNITPEQNTLLGFQFDHPWIPGLLRGCYSYLLGRQ